MIKIYYCNSASDAIPEEISDYRKKKILSASNLLERQRMINTARALKAGFAERGINEKDVIYGFQKNGKPYAQNFPEVYFSISHTDNLSIVAFCDKEIGVDCENSQRDISTDILNRYFSKEEVTAFSASAIALWVTKEAFVKYTGKGFAVGRSDVIIPYFENELRVIDYRTSVWMTAEIAVGVLAVLSLLVSIILLFASGFSVPLLIKLGWQRGEAAWKQHRQNTGSRRRHHRRKKHRPETRGISGV